MIRRYRKRLVHLLSLAFLLAQFGMLAHASSHLKADPHGAPTKSQLCGECLSFAPLQNAVGSAPTVVLAVKPPVHRLLDVDAVATVPPREFDAFRSRAPPISL
ncbi:MAG TPA: hypothetical protein VMF52_08725 [Steroidobacteraceae bacterium]|nr:hypothetical protein [Steroidobacteraceae bacterium]